MFVGAELNAALERPTSRGATEGPELPARRLGAAAADEAVQGAASGLATFRSVSGATFERTLQFAQDLSAVFGAPGDPARGEAATPEAAALAGGSQTTTVSGLAARRIAVRRVTGGDVAEGHRRADGHAGPGIDAGHD